MQCSLCLSQSYLFSYIIVFVLLILGSWYQAEGTIFSRSTVLALIFHFRFIVVLNVSSTWVHYPFTFIIHVLMCGEIWDRKANLSKEKEQGL